MQSEQVARDFSIFHNRVGNFNVKGKTLLLPEMNPLSSHLLAAVFRSFGANAAVMETYEGLQLGKEYTSGKECFPCQITLGDVLHYLNREKERLGSAFSARDYVYFMPGTDGPCRFGMYNKFQRIVLDTLGEYKDVRIAAISTKDAYSIGNLIDADKSRSFRKAAYCSVVIGDILERALWRVRPYETRKGSATELAYRGRRYLEAKLLEHSKDLKFGPVFRALDEVVAEMSKLSDTHRDAKPLIGIVGEIYVRTHVRSNQNLIETLERYGAEVVNASLAEWINYTTYDKLRTEKKTLTHQLRTRDFPAVARSFKGLLNLAGDMLYQDFRHQQLYRRTKNRFDIHSDHRVAKLDKRLQRSGLFSFDIGGEACLSIAGAVEYMEHGFNGVVNVYPFTCMPSTITSSVLKPLLSRLRFPYLDAPYDGTYQPGREAAIRTFMYQARQHFDRTRNGNGRLGSD